MRRLLALLLVVLLAGCASGSRVLRGGGPTTAEVAAMPARQALRVAVAPVLDRSGASQRDPDLPEAVRDMLITELHALPGVVVLDRTALDAARAEQLMAADAVPAGTLEGADLLLLAALTDFDPDAGGGALPIPFPIGGRGGDFGLLRLGASKGVAAMDLRIVEVATGRILATTAVRGSARRFGLSMDVYVDGGDDWIELPGVLDLYANTPIARALQQMTIEAAAALARSAGLVPASPP